MKLLKEFALAQFKDSDIENPQLEIRWILEKTQDREVIRHIIEQRKKGIPLAYLLKEKGFYKHVFYVEPGVLIPRPETELIVELGRKFLKQSSSASQIYDFGCGSGCIGLSLLGDFPENRLIGIDCSELAIEVSSQNADRLGLSSHSRFIRAKVEDLREDELPPADLIVMNPPYIGNDDPDVEDHVYKYEPHEALYSGPTGLECIERWCLTAKSILKDNGAMIVEFGRGQEEAVKNILSGLGFSKNSIYKDLAGIFRVIFAQHD